MEQADPAGKCHVLENSALNCGTRAKRERGAPYVAKLSSVRVDLGGGGSPSVFRAAGLRGILPITLRTEPGNFGCWPGTLPHMGRCSCWFLRLIGRRFRWTLLQLPQGFTSISRIVPAICQRLGLTTGGVSALFWAFSVAGGHTRHMKSETYLDCLFFRGGRYSSWAWTKPRRCN